MAKIKPCPKCRSKFTHMVALFDDPERPACITSYYVMCAFRIACGARGLECDSYGEAKSLWNEDHEGMKK